MLLLTTITSNDFSLEEKFEIHFVKCIANFCKFLNPAYKEQQIAEQEHYINKAEFITKLTCLESMPGYAQELNESISLARPALKAYKSNINPEYAHITSTLRIHPKFSDINILGNNRNLFKQMEEIVKFKQTSSGCHKLIDIINQLTIPGISHIELKSIRSKYGVFLERIDFPDSFIPRSFYDELTSTSISPSVEALLWFNKVVYLSKTKDFIKKFYKYNKFLIESEFSLEEFVEDIKYIKSFEDKGLFSKKIILTPPAEGSILHNPPPPKHRCLKKLKQHFDDQENNAVSLIDLALLKKTYGIDAYAMFALPTVNFLWVGEPKFDKGGQDVIGVESISANLLQFQNPIYPSNQLVFWCLPEYVDTYNNYFRSQNIDIIVRDFKEHLRAKSNEVTPEGTPTQMALCADQIIKYSNILLDADRNTVRDRVDVKNLLASYLAAEGRGYIIDSNLYAKPNLKVQFPHYAYMTFPVIDIPFPLLACKGKIVNTEIWMRFSTARNITIAVEILIEHLRLYSHVWPSILFNQTSIERHDGSALAAVKSTYTEKSLIADYNGETQTAFVSELGLYKEYANTHKHWAQYSFSKAFIDIMYNSELLLFKLQHGLDPNLTVNLDVSKSSMLTNVGWHYDAQNLSLLHLAVLKKNVSAIQLLLQYNANPNALSKISFLATGLEEEVTPLSLAEKICDAEIISLFSKP